MSEPIQYDELEKTLVDFLNKRLAGRRQTAFNSFRISRRLGIQGQVLRQLLVRLEAKGKVRHLDRTLWIFYSEPQKPEENDAFRFRTALEIVRRKAKKH